MGVDYSTVSGYGIELNIDSNAYPFDAMAEALGITVDDDEYVEEHQVLQDRLTELGYPDLSLTLAGDEMLNDVVWLLGAKTSISEIGRDFDRGAIKFVPNPEVDRQLAAFASVYPELVIDSTPMWRHIEHIT